MSENLSVVQALLDRHRAGDPRARNDLIAHSRRRFRRLTHQLLGRFPGVHQFEQTSDVLQNVLIRLDRALNDVPVTDARAFLALATRHLRHELIDLARHYGGPEGHATHLLPPGHGDSDLLRHAPGDSSADPARLADLHDLHCQIAALDADSRELFDLIYYQGLTQAEAARLLGVSDKTFQRHWQAARVRLALRLGGPCPKIGKS